MMKKILALFFGVFISLSQASDGLRHTDQEFYDEGVVLRKAGNYHQAKKCFSAAVFTDDKMLVVKAFYNLGHISHLEGRIQDAAVWFFQSNQAHIALNGTPFRKPLRPLKYHCQGQTLRTLSPAQETFSAPSRGIGDLFSRIDFSPLPRAISLKQSFTVKGGDVEVHFRDADHLRAVVKRTPLFSGKNTYYILDADVEDGKEFQASGGTGYWEKFVHVEGDEALQIKGYIGYMPFALILPEGSAYGNLTMTGFASRISIAGLNEPLKLLDYLVGISDDSITVQKEEALSLLAERCLDRETHSEKYPSLEKVAPKSILLSDGYIDSSQMDYVASENMPFYVGPDKVSLLSLKKALPLVFGGLFFIDSTLTSSGIYTDKSLCLEKGFSVSTLSNLVVYGDLSLKEYCVKITSGKNIWFIAASLRAASIEICPGVGFMQLPCSFFMERPENMPTELWDAFFKFRFQRTSYTI